MILLMQYIVFKFFVGFVCLLLVMGLILIGGGVWVVYQVGVLVVIVQLCWDVGVIEGNFFFIISGILVGVINVLMLVCYVDDFDGVVDGLLYFWQGLYVENIYCVDVFEVVKSGVCWVSMFSFGWVIVCWMCICLCSLFDNVLLCELLGCYLDMGWVEVMFEDGYLCVLVLIGFSYILGQYVIFFRCVIMLCFGCVSSVWLCRCG